MTLYWIVPLALALALAWWLGFRSGARIGYRDAERDLAVPLSQEDLDEIGREVVGNAVRSDAEVSQ